MKIMTISECRNYSEDGLPCHYDLQVIENGSPFAYYRNIKTIESVKYSASLFKDIDIVVVNYNHNTNTKKMTLEEFIK